MEVEVIELQKDFGKIVLRGIDNSFASALRRIMISEIPTMAIEWVDFIKNDSVMNDEVLANRLGLIPLTFDDKLYNLPEECKCGGKGCSRCQVELALKKKGPCTVYSGDLKSTAADVKPVFDKIPLTKLGEGEELEFLAYAQLGLGRAHAKWQAAVVGYLNEAKIEVGKSKKEDLEKLVKICPGKVFKVKEGELKIEHLKCILCKQCEEIKGVKVEPIEDSFIFSIESVCGLEVKTLIKKALKILEEKLEDFEKSFSKLS